jgi:phage-related protein
MAKMRIFFYKTKSGKEPVEDVIKKLEKADRAKVRSCFTKLQKDGLNCTAVIFRQIQGKLWEIKIKTSSGGYRIFYVTIKNEIIVCLHVYKKQSQKAPKKEIDIALKRMTEVLNKFKE